MNSNQKNISVNVLIVDDKEENIYALENLLNMEERSVNFLRATSGNEALKIAYKGDIALILLDVQMPEMDGYEVASYLKKSKTSQNIPIIFVTAMNHETKYVSEGYSKGAVDYLFKPLDPVITRSKVYSFIDIYIQQRKLEEAYNNLELIVQQRTSDLNKKNTDLNSEIEKRKTIEAELQIYNQKLISLNNNLDQFVYTASHDLKLPVANLEALISALEDELESPIPEDVLEILKMQGGAIVQLKNTINELIDIIRKENEGTSFETFKVKPVLEEIETSIASLINKSNSVIVNNFSEVEDFTFNRVAFKSLLYNLITNAIKYKHPDRDPYLKLNFTTLDGIKYLSVADNGRGMNDEEKGKLFNLFERMDNQDIEGTGMGLYIVKKLLDKYNVSIKVNSQKNMGTEFIFCFNKQIV
ncbi:MAG: hybrid sensor histidine kinase/response regulator [Opitutaceae bacterium]|nr:hybrid sensor histidine kinase/response regulator [Cytophagales bacterium]